MQCLSCQGDLAPVHLGEVTIEQCSACGGVWLERGELDELIHTEDEDVAWAELDLWKEAKKMGGRLSERECPRGHGKLVTVTYGDSDVEVDVCPVGGGVWLDPGELQKIVAYLREKALSLSVPEYIGESLEEAEQLIAGGDEGRLAEWKDLRAVLHLMRVRLAIDYPVLAALLRSIPR